MSKEFFIYPYRSDSQGALALSEKLNCYRINRTNSQFIGHPDKVIINWGNGGSLPSQVAACPIIINKPENCLNAIDKLRSFKLFIENMVNCPEFTTDRLTAQQWLNQGYIVFARDSVEGMDGAGIKVVKTGETLPTSSRFFTRGIVPSHSEPIEYRVNVFRGEALTYQKKVKVSDRVDHDPLLRTTSGGWAFEVEDEWRVPAAVDSEAIAAVEALGLDLGGVDIIHSQGISYVLEVNTAPHLTPYATEKLAQALEEYKNTL